MMQCSEGQSGFNMGFHTGTYETSLLQRNNPVYKVLKSHLRHQMKEVKKSLIKKQNHAHIQVQFDPQM